MLGSFRQPDSNTGLSTKLQSMYDTSTNSLSTLSALHLSGANMPVTHRQNTATPAHSPRLQHTRL